jgi:hypothetical protein
VRRARPAAPPPRLERNDQQLGRAGPGLEERLAPLAEQLAVELLSADTYGDLLTDESGLAATLRP